MRQILFRGKRVDTGEWCYGVPLVEGWSKKTYIASYEYSSLAFVQQIEVDPETLGQFTGLTDKNGKRIFEGDICQIKGISYIDETPFVVEWNDEYSGWFWRELSFSSPTDTITPEIAKTSKVIGNIHDNVELLTAERSDNENQ